MSQLEIELKQLKTEVVNMWSLVHSQMVKSNIALVNFDKEPGPGSGFQGETGKWF